MRWRRTNSKQGKRKKRKRGSKAEGAPEVQEEGEELAALVGTAGMAGSEAETTTAREEKRDTTERLDQASFFSPFDRGGLLHGENQKRRM